MTKFALNASNLFWGLDKQNCVSTSFASFHSNLFRFEMLSSELDWFITYKKEEFNTYLRYRISTSCVMDSKDIPDSSWFLKTFYCEMNLVLWQESGFWNSKLAIHSNSSLILAEYKSALKCCLPPFLLPLSFRKF